LQNILCVVIKRDISFVYTIELLGIKVDGIREISVDAQNHEIHVEYDGNPGSLERIAEIVRMIGYSANIRWDSVS
jgi:hypothetical protein